MCSNLNSSIWMHVLCKTLLLVVVVIIIIMCLFVLVQYWLLFLLKKTRIKCRNPDEYVLYFRLLLVTPRVDY